LPSRGVEEYLPGCLDSILGQPDLPAGIEVIAVDDASRTAAARSWTPGPGPTRGCG
jgi:glycosyltransferase involved in cell wall biosynthesis